MSALGLFDRLAGAAIERAFGEAVVITPQVNARHGGYRGADPSRPAKTINAVLAEGADEMRLWKSRHTGDSALGISVMEIAPAWLTVTAAAYASLGYEVAKGDLIAPVGRSVSYEVATVLPDDTGAILLELVKK